MRPYGEKPKDFWDEYDYKSIQKFFFIVYFVILKSTTKKIYYLFLVSQQYEVKTIVRLVPSLDNIVFFLLFVPIYAIIYMQGKCYHKVTYNIVDVALNKNTADL